MVELYLSIEGGEWWVVAVWRDAKGVGGGWGRYVAGGRHLCKNLDKQVNKSQRTNISLRLKSDCITCSGLWKPLAGCAGRASTSDLEKPTCSKRFMVNRILGTTLQEEQFLPRVSGSLWNFLVSTWCSEEGKNSSIMFGHFAGDHLEIVENFLRQFLLLSVGAKGLGLQNEGST